jgi:RNA polymerase sigma factor
LLDKEQESAEDIIIRNELHNDIMKILNSNDIKHRDRDIIIARFGLDGSNGKTLAEIGDKYGLTREAVRQIENRVLEKLRRHKHRKIIEAYIN